MGLVGVEVFEVLAVDGLIPISLLLILANLAKLFFPASVKGFDGGGGTLGADIFWAEILDCCWGFDNTGWLGLLSFFVYFDILLFFWELLL